MTVSRTNTMLLLLLQMAIDDVEALNYEDLSSVAHLASSDRYQSIMQVTSPVCVLSRAAEHVAFCLHPHCMLGS